MRIEKGYDLFLLIINESYFLAIKLYKNCILTKRSSQVEPRGLQKKKRP